MRHIEIKIIVGIPDCDYIDPSEIKRYTKEDFKSWFDSCFYDGDSEDRVNLLGVNVDTDYEENLDSLLEDVDIGDLDGAMG